MLRAADAAPFAAALSDADHRVRLRAIAGLVAARAAGLVAGAAADRSREVRVAVAAGLSALAAGLTETGQEDARQTLERLAGDSDVLVRAAAYPAAAAALHTAASDADADVRAYARRATLRQAIQ